MFIVYLRHVKSHTKKASKNQSLTLIRIWIMKGKGRLDGNGCLLFRTNELSAEASVSKLVYKLVCGVDLCQCNVNVKAWWKIRKSGKGQLAQQSSTRSAEGFGRVTVRKAYPNAFLRLNKYISYIVLIISKDIL